jgi:hypothetical protein
MRKLDNPERNKVLGIFEKKFSFYPSVSKFPGIIEPKESITFQFSSIYIDVQQSRVRRLISGDLTCTHADLLIDELHLAIFNTFREIEKPHNEIFSLDPYHQCYSCKTTEDSWGICGVGFPDGDYEILLSNDMSFGTFGHPWECSICIFGDQFVKSFLKRRPSILSAVIRNSGGYNVA